MYTAKVIKSNTYGATVSVNLHAVIAHPELFSYIVHDVLSLKGA